MADDFCSNVQSFSNPWKYFNSLDKNCTYRLEKSGEETEAYSNLAAADYDKNGEINAVEFYFYLESTCPKIIIAPAWKEFAQMIELGQSMFEKYQERVGQKFLLFSERFYARANDLVENDPVVLYALAIISFLKLDLGKTVDYLEQSIKANDSNADVWALLGETSLYVVSPNYERSETAIKKAIALKPKNAGYQVLYGRYYQSLALSNLILADKANNEKNIEESLKMLKLAKTNSLTAIEKHKAALELDPLNAKAIEYKTLCETSISQIEALISKLSASITPKSI